MASELPYFRFIVQEWQNGDIALESYEMQGLFISICGFYWTKDCSITLALLQKKFGSEKELLMIEKLIECKIIKHEKRFDKVEIVFLNEQFDLLSEKRKLRQVAGSKGGNAKAKLQQKPSYKIRKDKIIEDKIIKELPFSSEEFKEKWNILIQQKKWKGKSVDALNESIDLLSKNSEQDAIEMMKKSIAGGWQGLFELKEKKNGRTEQVERKPIENKKDFTGGFK